MIEGWQFNNAPWAIGVAAAFMLASVLFFFRSLKREGSTGGMVALHVLRVVIAAAVALTFLRPERVLLAKRSEQPRVCSSFIVPAPITKPSLRLCAFA